MLSVCIHSNPQLPNQTVFANYLQAGFKKHGIDAEISADIHHAADVHVVQGPHYGKAEWTGHGRTLWLNRAWWGPCTIDAGEQCNVSLGWLNAEGGLRIRTGCQNDRAKPELHPWKKPVENPRALFLQDYGVTPNAQILRELSTYQPTLRPHPNNVTPHESLHDAFERHDFAVGFSTTALVSAVIAGLPVVCFDPTNVVYPIASNHWTLTRPTREGWLKNLSYHQWSGGEIASGKAWEFLRGSM